MHHNFVKIVLLLASTALKSVLALNCATCGSEVSFEDCERNSLSLPCSAVNVNSLHRILREYNPGLVEGNIWAVGGYNCFRLKAILGNDESSVESYAQGCTYAAMQFCSGWKNADVLECSGAGRMYATGFVAVMVVVILNMFYS